MAHTGCVRFPERQIAGLYLSAMTAALTLCVVLVVRDFDSSATIWLVLTAFLLIGFSLCFYSLTVEITDQELRVRFGIGVVEKRFSLADIQSVRPVRNRWYYGWGVRLTPHGRLYNVQGLDAVELRLNEGRSVRIGSANPASLTIAIESAICDAE